MVLGPDVSAIATYCVVSATITAAICCFARILGTSLSLVDRPDGVRKLHANDTPLVGGIALLVPSFAVSIVYLTVMPHATFMIVALIAASLMLVVGLVDDRSGLLPVWRLLFMVFLVFAAFSAEPLFVLHVIRLKMFGFGAAIYLGPFAAIVTALFILGFVNASNMADGISGQLLGSIIIWSFFLARHLGIDTGLPFVALICSAGVTIVFNLRGQLFSGSSGAYAASLFVGLGAIAAYRKAYGAMPADLPLYWFWLPVLDCARLMVSRMLAKRSPFSGDRNHFHHVLQEYVPARYVLPIYLAMLAAPGAAAEINTALASVVLLLCVGGYTALIGARPSARIAPASAASATTFDEVAQPLAQGALRHTVAMASISRPDIAAE